MRIRCLPAACACAALLGAGHAAAQDRPYWNDIGVIRENTEAPRAHFVPYPDRAGALAGDLAANPWHQSLDGTWKFHYSESPAARPAEFFEPGYDVSAWADLPVPSNWERHGFGYPIYVNVPYPFEADEPNVPAEDNPVGSYRRDFELPADWSGRDVFIQFGAVSSAMYLWINGAYAGYSEGSKTPSEFDITRLVRPGRNTVAVEVYRWSTGSYLEDQDFWSLSGIQRGVTLYARPRQRLRDYFVHAGLANEYRDGAFGIEIDLLNTGPDTETLDVSVDLLDGDQPVISRRTAVELAPGEQRVRFDGSVPGVRRWSAELPNLYTLVIEIAGPDGSGREVVSQQIGFRTAEIVNGRFLVNGRPVKLRGVNRHEHHDVTGHVVDEATMLTDIRLMKGANVNAVRNSHYPQPERWYELTSQYGLYVVDEANIESHGYGYDPERTLGNRPRWREHHLDRTRRMLERSKNFPSVVIWSLGNEAGDGVNLGAGYHWIKSRDPSRPVQYEREGDPRQVGERHSDFHSTMYARHWDLEAYAQTHNDRPYVLIEYAHSMGNSTGNLQEYWDVINRHDILAGGFIWDWVDQGLLEHDADGTPYWAYGGDYGPPDVPSSGNFCNDGIVFPDRRVQPAYWEVKRAYQAVEFLPVNPSGGEFTIVNHYDFRTLDGYDLRWTYRRNGAVLLSAVMDAPVIGPGQAAAIELWQELGRQAPGVEYHLDLELMPAAAQGLLPADHVVARAQFAIPNRAAEDFPQPLAVPVEVREEPDRLVLAGGRASYAISRDTGLLSSITVDGQELMLRPLAPNFWRAPTDNDVGNGMGDWAAVWQQAGRNRRLVRLDAGGTDQGFTAVVAEYAFDDDEGNEVARWTAVYRFSREGFLQVRNRFTREDGLPEVPRIGMNMEVVRSLDRLAWFGRGPHENYADRQRSAHVGRYRGSVAEQYVPYLRPQENGYKTDVRWMSLSDGQGLGLRFDADGLMGFSVHHNRLEDFAPPAGDGDSSEVESRRNARHVNDVVPRDLVSVNLDYGQMGVGGDDSWGSRTLQRYMLNEKSYHYGFTIMPINE
jgi:beta-galactosidase